MKVNVWCFIGSLNGQMAIFKSFCRSNHLLQSPTNDTNNFPFFSSSITNNCIIQSPIRLITISIFRSRWNTLELNSMQKSISRNIKPATDENWMGKLIESNNSIKRTVELNFNDIKWKKGKAKRKSNRSFLSLVGWVWSNCGCVCVCRTESIKCVQ